MIDEFDEKEIPDYLSDQDMINKSESNNSILFI
jgi:hypothetical protein